jgi:ferric-dicitrate binding protein FerR (iron transport regulator)
MRKRVGRLELKHGRILTLLDPAARFTIAVPIGLIDVTPGCLLSVRTANTKTRLTCVRGKIPVTRLDRSNLAIEAGYVLESSGTDTIVRSAADDPDAQVDIANATAAEQQLRDVESRQSRTALFLGTKE